MSTRLALSTVDLLECSICFRDFDTAKRTPKVLHCGHTMCHECMDNVKEGYCMRCPICRTFMHGVASTNFQIMGFLSDKEKRDKLEKPSPEKGLYLRFGRSKQVNVHVAKKKGLESPEMYVRQDGEGDTSIVFASASGTPAEIIDYINKHEIGVETGAVATYIVKEGKEDKPVVFAKTTNMPDGVSPLRCTQPPKELEKIAFIESFDLRASRDAGGNVQLKLEKNPVVPDGTSVFGGTMVKVPEKRPAPVKTMVDLTDERPVSKRTRRGNKQ